MSGYDLVTGWGSPNGTTMISALANYTRSATGLLGIAGYFSCESDNPTICDTGTMSVTVNNTTESVFYDGSGNSGPGIPQTIAQAIANAFNSDPNSPVTASAVQDGYLNSNAWDVVFTAKNTGPGGDYSTSISVVPTYGVFSYFNSVPVPISWTWTIFAPTGGGDPNTLTEITPLSGALTGGR